MTHHHSVCGGMRDYCSSQKLRVKTLFNNWVLMVSETHKVVTTVDCILEISVTVA